MPSRYRHSKIAFSAVGCGALAIHLPAPRPSTRVVLPWLSVSGQIAPRQGCPPASRMTQRLHCVDLGRPPRDFGTMRALTPAGLRLARQVSPLTSPHLHDVPPPTTRRVPTSLSQPFQRVRCVSGFALSQQARHALPAESGSSPADRQFASGCSPPRLATTQLPSATEPWHTPTRTFTVLMRRPRGRTGSGALAATVPAPESSRRGGAPTWCRRAFRVSRTAAPPPCRRQAATLNSGPACPPNKASTGLRTAAPPRCKTCV